MDDQQQPRWRPTRGQLLWAGATVGLLTILAVAILVGYRYDITLWDWLKLLVVPAVIAGGGIWFNRQQRERELKIADERQQDEALQAYLDQMSAMLIPNGDQPSLYKADRGDSLSSVARARTLTVLPRLGADRKARVVQFLYESGLIKKGKVIVDLRGADLSGADLSGADLGLANLSRANLMGANLSRANLMEADLELADLREANLREAHTTDPMGGSGANLDRAKLSGADLSGAYLRRAKGRMADLNRADLRQVDLKQAKLAEAHLSGADLSGADLKMVDLSGADLKRADLSGADLSEVCLEYAKLNGATVTDEQLAQCWSLQGATMPDGQLLKEPESPHTPTFARLIQQEEGPESPNAPTFEDWLKSKGRG